MAQINVTLKATLKWWLMPLINCAVVWYWIIGRNQIAPSFIDWVVRHGITIEVK